MQLWEVKSYYEIYSNVTLWDMKLQLQDKKAIRSKKLLLRYKVTFWDIHLQLKVWDNTMQLRKIQLQLWDLNKHCDIKSHLFIYFLTGFPYSCIFAVCREIFMTQSFPYSQANFMLMCTACFMSHDVKPDQVVLDERSLIWPVTERIHHFTFFTNPSNIYLKHK